ncbi:hypothetical protein NHQ30_003919 [Ciborinia camelliae]|nr:hypothetical protein NHQ30_003919 [Ciborinia camelliae]
MSQTIMPMTPFDREYLTTPFTHQHLNTLCHVQVFEHKRFKFNIVLANENGTPPHPLSRRKQRAAVAEAALLSEDCRRALTVNCNGASAVESGEKLLQNPVKSLESDLNLPEDTKYNLTYFGAPGPELVSKNVPSCGLPPGWSNKHDRCIAYMSTHAPLIDGKVPRQEECQERHTTREITTFLLMRFPELCSHVSL